MKRIFKAAALPALIALTVLAALLFSACAPATVPGESDVALTSKDEVAAYIHDNGCLPDNFISKSEARELGWNGGSLEPYAPGMCIGGDRFGNYEGLLPKKDGRTYY